MESLKNGFTRVGRDAGAFVVDADSNFLADTRRGDFDEAARRRKADGIVDDRIDRPR